MLQAKYRNTVEFTKAGLVLSGGVTKAAAFHVGVCLALRDKGFTFVGGRAEVPSPENTCPYPSPKLHPHQIATYVGNSAGALVAGILASGIGVEALVNSFSADTQFRVPGDHPEIPRIQYRDVLKVDWPNVHSVVKNFRRTKIIGQSLESMILKNLRVPGIFSTKGLVGYLKKHCLPTDEFNDLKCNLFVVGTQLDHSRKIVFGRFGTEKTTDDYCQYANNAPISDAIGASMSLPPFFTPYYIQHKGGKDRYYIDGEVRDTLSTHVAKENGCDLIICSYTHQPYHYTEETGSLFHHGVPAIIIQAIYQTIEQKIHSSKKAHINKITALRTVEEFFKEKKYPIEDLKELTELLEERIDFKRKLNYIFIHPEAKDHEMFFGDHFTLTPKVLQKVVSIGYKRAMAELRKYSLVAKTT